ncbi:glycosyltransferase family 2 protein [Radiobacillus deserti]|uniref:Glycosyltransferase family 2 protein n=1 Tax=Radiobacillus deserti TaxID=2594883 RepID=A0A516KD15_9BACI|nr:glycosyltransferase family 2 protein [Radiobacillus deserti]QDP39301.1 glycosyltransferase family 2 protein [Radiobacillus deserti]
MKDITAVLINGSTPLAIQKALQSLEYVHSRLKTIMILTEQNSILPKNITLKSNVLYTKNQDPGIKLNELVQTVTTDYVLFLQDNDYLSKTVTPDTLTIPASKKVLCASYQKRNVTIHRPLLVKTGYLKEKNFHSLSQLPFKEALLPAWLSTVAGELQEFRTNLIKQARVQNTKQEIEKEKIMEKYQKVSHSSNEDTPSLSVMISNYNMANYIEIALNSCLLQSSPFKEILIIDDGSTDHSYSQLLKWKDEKLIHLYQQQNGGKARALNRLLPHVTSDFVLELDADDWLDSDAVSVIKQHLRNVKADTSVLYGNYRRWKQLDRGIQFKKIDKGRQTRGLTDLLTYRFPLGPRIYRTTSLRKVDGFPVIQFEDGRLYEDVSVLSRLIKFSSFQYEDFTVYNVREHNKSITKTHHSKWNDFLKHL